MDSDDDKFTDALDAPSTDPLDSDKDEFTNILNAPSTSPLVPDSHDKTTSIIPQRRGRSPVINVLEDAPSTSPLAPSRPHEKASVVAKKRGRPSNTSMNASSKKVNIYSKSWGGILAINQFELDNVFQEYLDANPPKDAASFFKNGDLPELNNPDRHHLEDFLRFCHAVDKMPHVNGMDIVRRLFLWVTVGDLANHIFGVYWSNTKKQELKIIVTNILDEDRYTTLQKKLVMAASLVFICRNLGIGALFWLSGQLNDHL